MSSNTTSLHIKHSLQKSKSFFIQYLGKKSALLFVISLPILLVIQVILTLFHQTPSSWVQFFTQSSDWKFSQLQAPTPEIIVYDNHYLCTVASQGDKKRVKYTRLGVRSGRAIPLNRQLCVANAFENILEERFPKTHKIIRTIYDNTGFNLAQKIKTKKAAHIVYYAMKPLEYVFLFVLYLVDPKPEDRINMQYTSARYDKLPKQARIEAKSYFQN